MDIKSGGESSNAIRTSNLSGNDTVMLDDNNNQFPMFPWSNLDDNIKEVVMARLPLHDLFRFRLAWKPWNSLVFTPTFLSACREIPSRQPWFLMLHSDASAADTIFDTDYSCWRHIFLPLPATMVFSGTEEKLVPVASSKGFMCFRSILNPTSLVISNPVTGIYRVLPPLAASNPIFSIVMCATTSSYKVMVVFRTGEAYRIAILSSAEGYSWSEMELKVTHSIANYIDQRWWCLEDWKRRVDEQLMSVAPLKWKYPATALRGIATVGFTGETVYFLGLDGWLTKCDLARGMIQWMPPPFSKQIKLTGDVVECGGRVLVVIVYERTGAYGMEVQEFVDGQVWKQVAVMPQEMAGRYWWRDVEIQCTGYGDYIMICISSEEQSFYRVVMFKLSKKSWTELPECWREDGAWHVMQRFGLALGFEPRLEATV